jgi:hypothetical protein
VTLVKNSFPTTGHAGMTNDDLTFKNGMKMSQVVVLVSSLAGDGVAAATGAPVAATGA